MNLTVKSALAGAFALSATTAMAQEDVIDVGMILPYVGVYASLGEEIDQGFVLALEEAGMTDRFNIIREDTEASPQVGVAATRKLVLQDEVDVLTGLVSSGVLAAIRDFVDQSQTPLIVSNAGNDEATGADCSPYITRVSFSNAQVNRPMGQWLYDQGVRTVYTLAPDYAAGRQHIGAFVTAFEAAGGEVLGQDYTPFGQTQDFGPYLTTAQAADPDAIFVFYAGGEAINFVKQYDSFGIKDETPLYGSGFLTSQLYLDAEGPAALGVITSLHYLPTLDTPENKAFVEAFQAKANRLPSEYAVQGYDAGRALVEAVKAGATDRESIKEALRDVQYTGPRGPLEIDPATNNIVQNVYIYDIVEGEDGKLTQELLDTVEAVRDEPNGCEL
ncbi:ABC transporter [Georhizobium profundi]|jgi:branched-chain amino acid transport system substrate-binding protein|uniref:ABC transporter n=1 Tax=Georhizobium profundi TaxID=2341112 RepID=A0A3S9B214_9HYPH|nr:ABC transporter substrate-binding protein [Georhizobium profundi]AZN70964.1 ABC transporter [Georhizobium profundi]